jgi:hypothetical protein
MRLRIIQDELTFTHTFTAGYRWEDSTEMVIISRK